MANVTLQAAKTALQVAVTNTEGEQDTINLAAGGTVVLDSTIVARSQGIFAMVADGRLVVTSGSMPSAVFTDVSVPGLGAAKGALSVAPVGVAAVGSAPTKAEYDVVVALVNELKTIINVMNA